MVNGPENNRFGGGAAGSTMHPVVLVLMLIAMVLIFVLPRKHVIVPILLTVFLTPFGQQIYFAGGHFFLSRLLILCGWVRVVMLRAGSRVEFTAGGMTKLDKVFLCWALYRAMAGVLVFLQMGAFINQVGFLWDSIGGYFLYRFLVRDEDDMERVIKTLAVVVSVLAITMTGERIQNQNVFGYIGGNLWPQIRDGAIRAGGTFQGPIPSGTFGATSACLFLWLWKQRQARWAVIPLIAAGVMVVTSASSTPLMASVGAVLGVFFWPARKVLRPIRWAMAVTLIALHLVMKAPVWMLIARVNLVGGNSAYHRAMLVDQFVKHFWDWWLVGVQSTRSWGWDMWDQANQFVFEGEAGGLITFICFIAMIKICFARLGTARRAVQGDTEKEWAVWLLGCTLLSCVVGYFGISLVDQLQQSWYLLLALIGAATIPSLADPKPIESKAPDSDKEYPGLALALASREVEFPSRTSVDWSKIQLR